MTNPYSTDPTNDPTSGSGARPGDAPPDLPIYLDPETHQQLYMDPVTGEFRYDPAPGTQPPPSAVAPSTPMGPPQYPAPQYPAQPYPYAPYPASYGYPPPKPTNNLAVASMVTSIAGAATLFCWGLGTIVGLVGAILGHIARRRIRNSGEGGDAMALTGIIVGWIVLALGIAGGVLVGLALSDV
jgi:hypothetical protein